ncbi:MAG: indole-3-glycerol phosphate synthase TrpC [Candidatus Omnitrophota bacterium]|nr:indole-3-glycerol phosphate synthase TrpC [Candidatus Omnitrophota bacterium]
MKKIDVLKEIIAQKKEKILLAKQQISEGDLKAKVQNLPPTRRFMEAISKPKQISLIAEIKKQSPSCGIIRQDFNLGDIARIYQDCGVQAISVLTEEDYFGGSISYINEIKNLTDRPILRKDFILESYQVYESRFYGADAILLIADLLSKEKLSGLMQLARELDLDCLVEVHDEKELKKILSLKVPLIGINNRDLHTLEVDFKITEKLFPLIPKGQIVVVESGIKSYQDILFLKILGVNAVLIGEAIMEAPEIKKQIEELMGW